MLIEEKFLFKEANTLMHKIKVNDKILCLKPFQQYYLFLFY